MLLYGVQVVDQLQSSDKSKRDGWASELPKTGLGFGVIDRLKDAKANDVPWQGKCSGTVYVYCLLSCFLKFEQLIIRHSSLCCKVNNHFPS